MLEQLDHGASTGLVHGENLTVYHKFLVERW
jgi:hypothetical protein